jgi:hypothetical protein
VGADALLPNFSLHKASLLLQKEKSRAKSASLIQLSPPSLSLSLTHAHTDTNKVRDQAGKAADGREYIDFKKDLCPIRSRSWAP